MNFQQVPTIWMVLSAAVYVIGLAACSVLASSGFAVGFAVGGALILANAWASARKVKKAEFSHRGRVMASLLGGFYLRLIALGVCLFGLIRYFRVDPVGLITGLAVVPAGLLVLLVLVYVANRRPEEV